jgi:hypothetical protein
MLNKVTKTYISLSYCVSCNFVPYLAIFLKNENTCIHTKKIIFFKVLNILKEYVYIQQQIFIALRTNIHVFL